MTIGGWLVMGMLISPAGVCAQNPVEPGLGRDAIRNRGVIAIPRAKPDLVITEIVQDPPNPLAGQRWRFKVTIRNQGATDAAIARGSKYMAHNASGVWRGITSGSTILIPPGQAFVGHQYVDQNTPGTHTITYRVDPDNEVAESDEGNNEKKANYTIVVAGKPDLVIDSVGTEPATPTVDGFRLRVTIRNRGQGVADIQGNRLILKTVGTDNVSLSGVINVLPGTTETLTADAVRLTAGSQTWRILADPEDLVSESDETNNERTVQLNISPGLPTRARPDLVITDLAIDPPNAAASDNWRFKVTIENQGSRVAEIPTGYKYMAYLWRDAWVGVTRASAISIAPGGTFTGTQYYTGERRAGTNTLTFKVDPDDVVQESSEANNGKSVTYSLR